MHILVGVDAPVTPPIQPNESPFQKVMKGVPYHEDKSVLYKKESMHTLPNLPLVWTRDGGARLIGKEIKPLGYISTSCEVGWFFPAGEGHRSFFPL